MVTSPNVEVLLGLATPARRLALPSLLILGFEHSSKAAAIPQFSAFGKNMGIREIFFMMCFKASILAPEHPISGKSFCVLLHSPTNTD